MYLFSGLPAGDYIVKVDAPNGTVSTIDNGAADMQNDNDNPDWNVDDNDNGDGVGGGLITSDITNVLTMTPGGGVTPAPAAKTVIITESTGTTTDNTVDFGFVGAVALGNVVWKDIGAADGHYNNGIFDTDESGVNGVTVNLYYDADSGDIAGTEATTPYRTTETAGGGFYQFDQLIPGRYQVGIPAIEFSAQELVGYTSSTGNGTSEDVDHLGATGDENGVDQTKFVLTDIVLPTGGIRSIDYVLTVGGEPNTADLDTALEGGSYTGTLADNSVNFTADFGFTQVVAIGNRVWFDTGTGLGEFNNSKQDGLEAGVKDVTVQLFSPGADGAIGGGDDVLVATTSTDPNGDYVFDGLKPDKYFVHIPDDNFGDTGFGDTVPGDPLAGYSSSVGQGNDETIDQIGDENGSDSKPAINGVSSPVYTLTLNGEPDGLVDDEIPPWKAAPTPACSTTMTSTTPQTSASPLWSPSATWSGLTPAQATTTASTNPSMKTVWTA